MVKKKEMKIIRELPPEFKEIKEREEGSEKERGGEFGEEDLEESLETETQATEEFVDFFPTQGSLPASKQTETETLDRTLEDVPSAQKTAAGAATNSVAEHYEKSVYNMPEYSYEKEAFPAGREMREAGFLIAPQDIRETKPRAEIEGWHELRQAETARRGEMREQVIESERMETERKLPFEQQRKYRRRI